ncbi:HAUS augmin-like complex subunit 6 N-terminus-domain-containing protein [Diplogelasinospora grovesii]|uniref:HAUS augmin-like complex subunit 6 N-terminus-domain-containing protein n=1 Tax=Diplogelasinospora grovesii TaxID=303347 RepID=A0AAN6N8A1_9PEZI|nr:HAUS augmin-like complex subunit 6 N-terminus-domain-containing protein [Diplogelasinospora grovesii]
MAHLQGSSSLVRTRSTRMLAGSSSSKPTQSSSRLNVSTISATSSVTAASAPPPTARPPAASNVALFLTNLRLLDLDLHPDWPDINALTFTNRDLAQGQKKRIQCVEWALYQLWTLWDPEEARNKLQPFFPPLDQVQSLNLRAALLRCLEQAKKNGVLGRDAVVRKTMLDECKGERLEEALAAFSSAVLKKVVAEQQLNGRSDQYPALAQTLALEHRGYSDDRTELTALVLAHKVSLSRLLADKNAARVRYSEFVDLLKSKEGSIARRREQAEALKAAVLAGKAKSGRGREVSDDRKLDVWRTVRNNWSGNERWMETLLYGDSTAHKDGLLSAPFDRVWRRVQAGRLSELQDKSDGLLEQLESRVQTQKERLQKWQGFRQKMFGKAGPEPAASTELRPKQKGIDLGFRAHETLHYGRMSPRKLPRGKPGELQGEYAELIQGLEAELATIKRGTTQVPAFFRKPRAEMDTEHRRDSSEQEVVSELSDLEEEPLAAPQQPLPPSYREPPARKVVPPLTFEPTLRRSRTIGHAPLNTTNGRHSKSSSLSSSHKPLISPTFPSEQAGFGGRRPVALAAAAGGRSPPSRSPELKISPPPLSPTRSPVRASPVRARSPPIHPVITASPEQSPELRPVSPTQQLADQILASVSAASPSPVKRPRHTLSLAERTRLSLARRKSAHFGAGEDVDEDPEQEIDRLLPVQRALTISVETVDEPNGSADADEVDEYQDLVARTRRSMAGFEAARQKAQLERRRSQRKSRQTINRGSYFPAVGEEEEGNSTLLLAEELMSGEQDDYNAVFMSRPKIKTSPVGTPIRGWD